MQVISNVFDKTLQHISVARSSLMGWGDDRGEAGYQTSIIRAVELIEALRLTLNTEGGSSLAHNIDDVYRYSAHKLLTACESQSVENLNEVQHLLFEIREAIQIVTKSTDKMLQH